MSGILETRGLTRHFRGLVANQDIDFSLATGEIRAIIGPNGAGKTTFLSMISGHLRPSGGRVIYKGADITKRTVAERARLGIARKFQTPTVFDNLSVYRNVELAVLRTDSRPAERDEQIHAVLCRVRLEQEADTPAQFLSHGQRQWLEIGLLVALRGELLLLDEPTAGMTAEETASTGELVIMLARDMQLSVIIIEHDINFIRNLRAPVTVFHLGRILKEGSFAEVAEDERVRAVYLGTGS